MKSIIAALILCCCIITVSQAQNKLTLVPSSATFVVKYAGENFTKNISVKKIDSYGFIKDEFFKLLHLDKRTSLQNTGINFEQDSYQYVVMQDTCINLVSLLNIKNEAQFLKLIKDNYNHTATIIKKDGYNIIPVSNTSFIGWSKNMAVIVNSTYQNRKYYYNNDITIDTGMVEIYTDTAVAIVPDTTMSAEETEAKEQEEQRIRDSIYNFKWELWEQQQDMIAKKQQQATAEKIIQNSFAGNVKSIANDVGYQKIIDPTAHVSTWFNTESIFNQYMNYFNRGTYGVVNSVTSPLYEQTDGFNTAVNIYFDKDKLRMEQKTFSANDSLNKLSLAVMNNKQSNSLINFVNPGNIGYLSMSINTEAMANYYYPLLKSYLGRSSYMNDYADLIDVYIDLVQIIIDEKGIAELLPGNYMFVMHDMKAKMVDYTDYEYDEEYNRKEVKKTKKELSPDFTFAFESNRTDFLERIAHLPLKYAEKEHFDYKQKDGYYVLTFDSGKYPISSLYFMVKDGKAVITTSNAVINMVKNNTAFTTDEETKKAILANNYSMQLNSTKLIEKLQTQISTDVNMKVSDYLKQNLGDVKMESRIKDGMIQGTTTLNIKGKHNNSLEFFFNMIDGVNSIIEKDRQDKEKKLN
ncbi:MAG TPA: hypothetical protein PK987_01765 [Ferruginibacter sp.]|nr:hypothetical protein [Ferruginibacter sp.]